MPLDVGLTRRGSASLPKASNQLRQRRDVAAVLAERIDEGRRDDDPVCAGLRQGPDVRRPADPEADSDRDRETAPTSRTSFRDVGRQGGAGAGDADERDAVQNPPDRSAIIGAARPACRRRDQVDDGETRLGGDRLERRALVRREVGDDDPGRSGLGEPRTAAAPSPPPMTWFA